MPQVLRQDHPSKYLYVIGGWRLRLDRNAETARHKFRHSLRTIHIPIMATMTALRDRADAMIVNSPSTNDIVERGWKKSTGR